MRELRSINFEHLAIFVAVAESGSLSAAAQRLRVGKTTVTKAIQRLESELGEALIARTTRSLSITSAGERFLVFCHQVRRLAQESLSSTDRPDILTGTLRVATSIEYCASVVAPLLTAMRQRHPDLRIELLSDDRATDLVGAGVDVAIRLGELADSSLRATRITSFSRWLVCSPALIPADADRADSFGSTALAFIADPATSKPPQFQVEQAAGVRRPIRFRDDLYADTAQGCRALAVAGGGVALLPDFWVIDDIAAGRLVRVFPSFASSPLPIHAILVAGRYVSAPARAFIDALKARYGTRSDLSAPPPIRPACG